MLDQVNTMFGIEPEHDLDLMLPGQPLNGIVARAIAGIDALIVAERPDAVWLADISHLPTGEGWLYLAAVEDMATREIVGWSMADHLRAGLCTDALVMALQRCRPPRGLIHHSDLMREP